MSINDTPSLGTGYRNWSWDPSMGSAMNCYDENHGHIAGKGAYKGWRRCIELKGKFEEYKETLKIDKTKTMRKNELSIFEFEASGWRGSIRLAEAV